MLVARTMQISSSKVNNLITTSMLFYRIIKEIWELNFNIFSITMFLFDWVESKNGVKVDDLEFTVVSLSQIGHKCDTFIMATQAKQIVYVDDPINS